jgi:hypothetical protein
MACKEVLVQIGVGVTGNEVCDGPSPGSADVAYIGVNV